MRLPAAPVALMAASAASLFLGFTVLGDVVAGFILYYLACCIGLPLAELLVLRRLRPGDLPRVLGLGRLTRGNLALGLAAGTGMLVLMLAALVLLREPVFGDGTIMATLASWGAGGDRLVPVFLVMVTFNGVVEELFWRGYLHERLSGLGNRLLANALPAACFGLQHVFVVSSLVRDPWITALFLAGITGAGAAWAFLRERSGSLWPSLLSHVMVTAGYMGAFGLMSPAA